MEKFIAWDENNNKVWEGMAADEGVALEFAIADHKELKVQKLTIKKVVFVNRIPSLAEVGTADMTEPLPQTAATDANPPKEGDKGTTTLADVFAPITRPPSPIRKSRADKGVPRKDKPAEKPEPKKRRKVYHLAMGTLVTFESLAALENRLAELDRDAGTQVPQACVVVEGGKVRSIQKRFSLK